MLLEVYDYDEKNFLPISVFKEVRKKHGAPIALLEAALSDDTSPFSFIGFCPVQEIISNKNTFKKLNRALIKSKKFPKNFHISGGLMGYFNWEIFEEIEKISTPSNSTCPGEESKNLPHAIFYEFSRFFIFDHKEKKIFAIQTNFESPEKFHEENKNILKIVKRKKRNSLSITDIQNEKNANFEIFQSEQTKKEFQDKVSWAKEKILDGEVFQMIVSNEFKTKVNKDGIDFYEALRTIEPTTHLFFLDFGKYGQIAGASPEVLGAKRGKKVIYSPIAGTRFRGEDAESDQEILEEMCTDPKENAEHDMLIDLGRNDLGRVCKTSSIKITKEKYAKKFANLMHLVTDIEGEIKDNLSSIDFFKAIFPAGTLSGAPKIRAIDLISQIEPNRRDLYGGAVGYFSADGDMEFCIAIRSFTQKDGIIKFRTGAGIVQDSDPAKEWLEVHNKAKSLCKVINFTNKD